MTTKITSAGILRNVETPRVGVLSQGSLDDWFFDQLYDGSAIDLTYEEMCEDIRTEVESDESIAEEDKEREIEERIQCASDAGFEARSYLLGAWIKGPDGKYGIDRSGASGDYAATYSTDSGTVCVEWSTLTKWTHHTSPCFVMANGSGPCGDLDTPGDSVLAYTLPPGFFRQD